MGVNNGKYLGLNYALVFLFLTSHVRWFTRIKFENWRRKVDIGNIYSKKTADDVVKKLIKSYGYSNKFNEYEVVEAFSKIMGSVIMKKVDDAYVYNSKLVLKLTTRCFQRFFGCQDEIINEKYEQIWK